MEEQNNRNVQNQKPEENNHEAGLNSKKAIPKMTIIIGALVVVVVAIAVVLAILLGGKDAGGNNNDDNNDTPTHTHSFGSWQETVKGDCYTTSSVQKRICQDCQYEETKTLSPSHNYSNGVCTKCEKPLIENMTLGKDVNRYKATLMNKKNVSVYGITWKDIVAAETPNTYHCKIGFSVYQYDYSSYVYAGDYVDLKYVITDSSDNIVLEETVSCMLSGGSVSRTTFYTSEISRFNFEFDITLDPNETYLFSIKVIGGI